MAGNTLSTALTFLGSRRETTVFLRYQIPSPVCHASSASMVRPLTSLMTTGPLPRAPGAVEIGFELLSTGAELVCGEGASMLGDGEGSTEGSSEVLAVARGAGGKLLGNSCCRVLELELVVSEVSCVV